MADLKYGDKIIKMEGVIVEVHDGCVAIDLKYGDRIIKMEGVIVEVHDGCVAIDLKGRLGYLKVPMRMFISDYEIKVGQEVAWNMSFVEQMGPQVNEKYISNLDTYTRRQKEMREKNQKNEEV